MGRSQDPAAQDRYENELLAAGAVFMALLTSHNWTPGLKEVKVVTDEHQQATTAIDVEFTFMKSRYRITVTTAPEEPF